MAVLLQELGRYRILRAVARSGMADVYLARDPSTGAEVVLKVPRTDDPGMRESEKRGALLQSLLSKSDPRVPRLLDMDEDAGLFFLVMEYVPGEDLAERIRRGPLPWREALAIAREVADLLAVAHAFRPASGDSAIHGIVHGDIKPRNVRLAQPGLIKVLDFGIAKALSASRRLTRNEFGSLPYSSPERIDSGQVDASTDLWAVGVVLHEMLAGGLPFSAESTRRLEQRILERAPAPALPDAVPAPVAAIVAKALAPAPADRYASADALREDLDAVLRGEEPRALRDRAAQAAFEDTRRTTAPTLPLRERQHETTERTTTTAPAAEEVTRRTAAVPAARSKRKSWRRFFKLGLGALLFLVTIDEILVLRAARELRHDLASARRADAGSLWERWEDLSGGNLIGAGTLAVRGPLADWLVSCADELTVNYLSDVPTIRESGWQEAAKLLRRALILRPDAEDVRARLLYCEGHLHRINGQARLPRAPNEARAEFHEAVSSFRKASELRGAWPDPYLGLARTYIYGLDDLDHGIEALERAEKAGYELGNRETAQLADGYRKRATRLMTQARGVRGLPQENGILEKVEEDCGHALSLYESIPAYGDVGRQIRAAQGLLREATTRRDELRAEEGFWSRIKRTLT